MSCSRIVSGSQYMAGTPYAGAVAADPVGPPGLSPYTMTAWSTYPFKPHSGIWMDPRYPNLQAPQTLDVGMSAEVNSLMPSSWRTGGGNGTGMGVGQGPCSSTNAEMAQWAQYSPSKPAFDKQLIASSSVRMSALGRDASSRILGMPNLLLQQAPVPISSNAITFQDSSLRQNAFYVSTGAYPSTNDCC